VAMLSRTERSDGWWASLVVVGTFILAGCGENSDDAVLDPVDPGRSEDADTKVGHRERTRGEGVGVPLVHGPITYGERGLPFNPMPARLADEYDYVEEEYFIAGGATAYEPAGDWGEDGEWVARPSQTALYQTRMLVRKPADAEAFNGTVVVEWLNSVAGVDLDFHFMSVYEELLREGYVWVGVSAQRLGVEGGLGTGLPTDDGNGVPGLENPLSLKKWDPQRYGELAHPGDDYSYDIYSQAAQVLSRPVGVDPLEGLAVEQVIAAGMSQAAARLVTYVNAVHPIADIYDGFLIQARFGQGAPLVTDVHSTDVLAAIVRPGAARIRTDLSDPVMQVETETDLFVPSFVEMAKGLLEAGVTEQDFIPFHATRQPDTGRIRTWEVAGAAHLDQRWFDYMSESIRIWDESYEPGPGGCRVNDGPGPAVVRAALAGLTEWVGDGEPPAPAEPLEVAGGALVRDEHGNAVGGVRTPAVQVPIATLTGEADCVESGTFFDAVGLFGSTTPFDQATLASLYPTHGDYVQAVRAATREAVDAGFLLPADGERIIEDAELAGIPE
jgi:hypothetical protein